MFFICFVFFFFLSKLTAVLYWRTSPNIQIICMTAFPQHGDTLRCLRKRRKADKQCRTAFGPVSTEPHMSTHRGGTGRDCPASSTQRGGAQPIKNAMASSAGSPPRPGGSANTEAKPNTLTQREGALACWGLSLISSSQTGIHTVRLHKGLHCSQPPYGWSNKKSLLSPQTFQKLLCPTLNTD